VFSAADSAVRAYTAKDLTEKGLWVIHSAEINLKDAEMSRNEDAMMHLNWARQAETQGDFFGG
jgi:hypothetical protein